MSPHDTRIGGIWKIQVEKDIDGGSHMIDNNILGVHISLINEIWIMLDLA